MPCSGRSCADGAKRRGQQTDKSEDILPNFGKPGLSADHLSRAEVARTSDWGGDAVRLWGLKEPHLSRAGLAMSRRCQATPRRLALAAARQSPGKRVL